MELTLRGSAAATPALIEAAKSGDRDAWSELYRCYQGMVLAFLIRRTGNPLLAEDLTQDTFVRAMAGIHGYHWTGKDMGAWIITIARNIMLDHDKRRSTRRESAVATVADVDSGVRVEEAVIAAVDAARVFAALAGLNDRQRTVMTMRYWDELTSNEIADRIGLRVGAVKTLTYRARVNLRRSLADDDSVNRTEDRPTDRPTDHPTARPTGRPADRQPAGRSASSRCRESAIECSWKPRLR